MTTGRDVRLLAGKHAIAFAPRTSIEGGSRTASRADNDVSAVSMRDLASALVPLLTKRGGSIVGAGLRRVDGMGEVRLDGCGHPAVLGHRDAAVVADPVCCLLSDLSRGISGEILQVDAGFHAVGGT